MEGYIVVLLVFMILSAIVAIETKNLLSSIISIGAVGFGLSITFLLLHAPDLAIVQVSVEVILLIFLIRATVGRDIIPEQGHVGWVGLSVVVILILGILAFGIYSFQDLQAFGRPIATVVQDSPSTSYISNGLEETGAPNIVTSILLDYRAYDTLGEATVLFAAVIGALAILRGRSRSKQGGDE